MHETLHESDAPGAAAFLLFFHGSIVSVSAVRRCLLNLKRETHIVCIEKRSSSMTECPAPPLQGWWWGSSCGASFRTGAKKGEEKAAQPAKCWNLCSVKAQWELTCPGYAAALIGEMWLAASSRGPAWRKEGKVEGGHFSALCHTADWLEPKGQRWRCAAVSRLLGHWVPLMDCVKMNKNVLRNKCELD